MGMQQNYNDRQQPGQSRYHRPSERKSQEPEGNLNDLRHPQKFENLTMSDIEVQLTSNPLAVIHALGKEWLQSSKILGDIAIAVENGMSRTRTESQADMIEALILVCPSANTLCFDISHKTGTGEEISRERHKLLGHAIFFYELVDYDPLLAEEVKRYYDGDIEGKEEIDKLSQRVENFFKADAKEFPSVIGFMLMRQKQGENKSGAVDCLRGIFKPYFELQAEETKKNLFQKVTGLFGKGDKVKSLSEQRLQDIKEAPLSDHEHKLLRRLISLCNTSYIKRVRDRKIQQGLRDIER